MGGDCPARPARPVQFQGGLAEWLRLHAKKHAAEAQAKQLEADRFSRTGPAGKGGPTQAAGALPALDGVAVALSGTARCASQAALLQGSTALPERTCGAVGDGETLNRVFPIYKWGQRADHVRVTIPAAGYDAVCATSERVLLAGALPRRLAAAGQADCVATFRPEGYATIKASNPKAGEFFVIELDLAGSILAEGCSLQEPAPTPASS